MPYVFKQEKPNLTKGYNDGMQVTDPVSGKQVNTTNRKYYDFTTVVKPGGNFFQGTWDTNQMSIDNYTPLVSGYSYIYWTKLPDFLADISIQINDTNVIDAKTAFKWMTIRNFKSFEGLDDIELSCEDLTGAYGSNKISIPSGVNKGNTGFTLKHNELSGSPIRRLYEMWVNSIIDVDTGISNYAGMPNRNNNMYSFQTQNHTGELMYIVTDPSGGAMKNSIEFVGYYTNVFPTKIPLSHLNYNSGDHNLAEIDIPFNAVFHQNLEDDYLYREATKLIPYLQKFRCSDEFMPTFGDTQTTYYIDNIVSVH